MTCPLGQNRDLWDLSDSRVHVVNYAIWSCHGTLPCGETKYVVRRGLAGRCSWSCWRQVGQISGRQYIGADSVVPTPLAPMDWIWRAPRYSRLVSTCWAMTVDKLPTSSYLNGTFQIASVPLTANMFIYRHPQLWY